MNRAQNTGNRPLSDTSAASVADWEQPRQDLRVRKTYATLVAAFERLTAQYGYDDISVSALCNEAMVRRSTFYKHFADKDEFLLYYFHTTQREFERRASVRPDETLESYLPRMNSELLRFIEGQQPLVTGFLRGSQANLIVQALADHIARNLRVRIEAEATDTLETAQAAALASFIAGGIAHVIQHEWIPADGRRRQQVEATLYATEVTLLQSIGDMVPQPTPQPRGRRPAGA